MLELVRDYAVDTGIEFAWHTGSVPQPRRRAEIRRFREDPACRLFLSSESGGVGLNLQAADTVVNLHQPWNPARLEQRIARAWRKLPDPSGQRHQPGQRKHHRAPNARVAGCQARTRRRSTRPARRLSDIPCRPAGPPSWSECRRCSAPGRSSKKPLPAHHLRPPRSIGYATTWWASTAGRSVESSFAKATTLRPILRSS